MAPTNRPPQLCIPLDTSLSPRFAVAAVAGACARRTPVSEPPAVARRPAASSACEDDAGPAPPAPPPAARGSRGSNRLSSPAAEGKTSTTIASTSPGDRALYWKCQFTVAPPCVPASGETSGEAPQHLKHTLLRSLLLFFFICRPASPPEATVRRRHARTVSGENHERPLRRGEELHHPREGVLCGLPRGGAQPEGLHRLWVRM